VRRGDAVHRGDAIHDAMPYIVAMVCGVAMPYIVGDGIPDAMP
jgi:hypothetical protein